jgi:hypothetical protein
LIVRINRRSQHAVEPELQALVLRHAEDELLPGARRVCRASDGPCPNRLSRPAPRATFVSRGINDDEPPIFSEPALFLISPDATVYYEAILSVPVGRPRLDDLLGGIEYWTNNQCPARGGD